MSDQPINAETNQPDQTPETAASDVNLRQQPKAAVADMQFADEDEIPYDFTYVLTKSLRIALITSFLLMLLSVAVYFLAVKNEVKQRFDKGNAIRFLRITDTVLSKYSNRKVTPDMLDGIQVNMLHSITRNNVMDSSYHPVPIRRFFDMADTSRAGQLNTSAADFLNLEKKISTLPDTSSGDNNWMRSFVASYLHKDVLNKFSLGQFFLETNTWNDLDEPARYAVWITGIIFMAVLLLILYDAGSKRIRYEHERQKKESLRNARDINKAWINAQSMLQAYHQRNLRQNTWTFFLSVFVMCLGFWLIFTGIHKAIALNESNMGAKDKSDGTSLISIISTASGVIVSLIGGSFLALYNSTLKQAISYTNSLQKTSTVGTSLAILESIKQDQKDAGMATDPGTATKIIEAKIAIAKQLIGTPVAGDVNQT
jgi:hypothetical protein